MKKTMMRLASVMFLGVLGSVSALGGGCSAEEVKPEEALDNPGEGEEVEVVSKNMGALSNISRNEVIELAKSGVGYSYWWGFGRWRPDGAQHGSCVGGCPSCKHTGDYGADCSGFAAKVWQVPQSVPVDVNSHPYSTKSFRYTTAHWDVISRSELQPGDALVHNDGSAGHIVIYESTTPSGAYWVYECRGCSYGCVHNARSFGSQYIAIRRRLFEQVSSADGCTDTQRDGCGKFGCDCVNGKCAGGFCDGNGCTTQQTEDCGKFGCACVDGQCAGGFCGGSGCTAKMTDNCGKFTCGCVDGQCSGGACAGTGCTAKQTEDCGKFGCGCADGKCAGGACDGNGCTAKHTEECGNFGCACVDGDCNGGFCPGTGCTWKQTDNCSKFGCGCVDGECAGGACPGTGCTAKMTSDCSKFGCGCANGKCAGGACPN